MAETKPPTHSAIAKRQMRGSRHWVEIGKGRVDSDDGSVHVLLDRLPIGGFDGYILLLPIGAKPPAIDQPQRPAQTSGEEEYE
jgi:hypothetical protein